jgi:glutamine amidotransferase
MIAIIDYRAGNIASVKNALERLGQSCVITSKPEEILSADGVIFPGQGRAGTAMLNLSKTGIDKIIPQITKPFLGICLGMQLLGLTSEEDRTKCLEIFQSTCRRFPPIVKTPHLGWNKVELTQKSPLTVNTRDGSYFYFVHSYYVDGLESQTVGKTSYGFDFTSIMQKDNFFAVQFHPEKSGERGLRLLNNFCKLC